MIFPALNPFADLALFCDPPIVSTVRKRTSLLPAMESLFVTVLILCATLINTHLLQWTGSAGRSLRCRHALDPRNWDCGSYSNMPSFHFTSSCFDLKIYREVSARWFLEQVRHAAAGA